MKDLERNYVMPEEEAVPEPPTKPDDPPTEP